MVKSRIPELVRLNSQTGANGVHASQEPGSEGLREIRVGAISPIVGMDFAKFDLL
jgi:hypothetical protein